MVYYTQCEKLPHFLQDLRTCHIRPEMAHLHYHHSNRQKYHEGAHLETTNRFKLSRELRRGKTIKYQYFAIL